MLNTRTGPCISPLRYPTVAKEKKREKEKRAKDLIGNGSRAIANLTLAFWLGSELRPLGELYNSLETTHRNSV